MGIYESLENCFNTSSRSPEEAIKNAHLKRDLRQAAVDQGDVKKVKQLTLGDAVDEGNGESGKQSTWASIKFQSPSLGD